MSIIQRENQKLCEELKQSYIDEMKDILFECQISWGIRHLNPETSPNFISSEEKEQKEFYILLGKYLAIDEIQKRL